MDINKALQDLVARLPELEWRLGEVGRIAPAQLPRGLFQCAQTAEWLSVSVCVDEIKRDLNGLQGQEESLSSRFMAEQVSKKINVLLRVCQVARRKAATTPREPFGVRCLSTRQQWLNQLQGEIDRLSAQQHALQAALDTCVTRTPDALLALQRELGEVTRYLVTAEEAFMVATGEARRNYQ